MRSCTIGRTVTLPEGGLPDGTLDVKRFYPDAKEAGPASPPDASVPVDSTHWFRSKCDAYARYRLLDNGKIEIDGVGIPDAGNNWPTAVEKWKEIIDSAAEEFVVPPAFIAGVMSMESGGIPSATSSVGAAGLMQLMPATANGLAGRDLSKEELYDPKTNVRLGAKFLGQLLDRYEWNMIHVLGHYNTGSVQCRTGKGCEEDHWNIASACGFIDRIFAYYNTAVDKGFYGTRVIDLGDEEGIVPAREVGGAGSFGASVAVGVLVGVVGGLGWFVFGRKP